MQTFWVYADDDQGSAQEQVNGSPEDSIQERDLQRSSSLDNNLNKIPKVRSALEIQADMNSANSAGSGRSAKIRPEIGRFSGSPVVGQGGAGSSSILQQFVRKLAINSMHNASVDACSDKLKATQEGSESSIV
jgi:hypothetical protein